MKRPIYEDYDMIYHSQIYIDHLKKYADYLEDKAIRRRSKIGYIIFVVLVLGSCLCCLGQDKIHKDEVYDYILASDIYEHEIVYKQVLLETGHLKSYLCTHNHNLFAMRLPRKRETLAIGEEYRYAIFRTWQESIDDYCIWQQTMYKDTTENYYDFLDRVGYATSKEYTNKLKSINI